MSWDEFLVFAEDVPEGVTVEWAHGEAIMIGWPSFNHQVIQSRLLVLLATALPTAIVVTEPGTRTGSSHRRPDLVVVAHRPDESHLVTQAPLVMVEILSPSTRTEDLLHKSGEYAASGARQYWVVEPEGEPSVEVLENRDGTWATVTVVDSRHPAADITVTDGNTTYGTVHVDHAALFRQ
jgi:Uma2 family endonuclease